MKSKKDDLKICSRGHKYRGAGPCPVCWPGRKGRKEVDAYIARAPKEARLKLKEMRKTIQEVAPRAAESISYRMPAYDNGRIAWFASMKGYVGLYLRPPIIEEHKKALAGYITTKSAIHFPLDEKFPIALIKKLVRARMNKKL